jgi:hypothetical protein
MSTGDITTRISNDTNLYQEGISDKIGLIIQNFSTLLGGFVIAFIKCEYKKIPLVKFL